MDKQSNRLEDLLDKTLAEYAAAEPRPELERRVLHYARNHAGPRAVWNRPLIGWLGTASVVLATASILWLGHGARQPTPKFHEREISPMRSALPKPGASLTIQSVSIIRQRPRRLRVTGVLPKREVFPTPSPLSSEERALLAYAKHPPKEIPAELTELGGPIEPIQIETIQIKPLDQITSSKEN